MKPIHVFSSLFALSLLCIGASHLAQRPNDALEQAKKNVVRFEDEQGSCSGIIINKTLLITAGHCVSARSPVNPLALMLGIPMPQEPHYHLVKDGTALAPASVDHYVDLATFHGALSPEQETQVDGRDALLYVVDKAVLCGYPAGNNTLRCVKANRLRNMGWTAIFDVVIIPGESGGGVFTEAGVLIGVIQAQVEDGAVVMSTTGALSNEANPDNK